MHTFLIALASLTIIPIRFHKLPTAECVAASRFWYPVVGLLLGAALGGWMALASAATLSTLLVAFLTLLAWVTLTGALHLDGFFDLCDGLFGGHTPEERLRIMHDPHLGTFALAGGVLLLVGKLVALNELVRRWSDQAPWLVGAAVLIARCLALAMAGLSRYPRPEGTGKALVTATQRREVVAYVAIAAAVLAATPDGDWLRKGALFLVPCLAVLSLTWLCQRRLGGVTGDCLGAAIETAEVTFLFAAVVLLPA
jgi:cobalamin 5'-phosphate synthase/cobalamin synthase